MNSGMATLINNYYRKRTDRDPYIPEVCCEGGREAGLHLHTRQS